MVRWTDADVAAFAPTPAAYRSAVPLADPTRWRAAGADHAAVWGRYIGSASEPYDVTVVHAPGHATTARSGCTCPSRRVPCKHALGLLMAWAHRDVPDGERPPAVARRVDRLDAASLRRDAAPGPSADRRTADGRRPSAGRDDRMAKLADGLDSFDRWLLDCIRLGLADPAVRDPAAWELAASRLVDAGAGSLANRVRRLASVLEDQEPDLSRLAEELAIVHLLAVAARRSGSLPDGLADAVAIATGWQVRRTSVLDGVPESGDWFVVGRHDTREDRIEVRRTWLRSLTDRRWAMLLSFAATGDGLDASFPIGGWFRGDVFRYPGATYPNGSVRALVGTHGEVGAVDRPVDAIGAVDVTTARAEVGRVLAREPWTERVPVVVDASPTRAGRRWVLSDQTASIPLDVAPRPLAVVLAASQGRSIPIMVEWTRTGAVPVSVIGPDRVVDVGRRA